MRYFLTHKDFSLVLMCETCDWSYEWRHRSVIEVEEKINALTDSEWSALGYQ